jgi:hypothetical protein
MVRQVQVHVVAVNRSLFCAGIGVLSHSKKANFWRDICATFPSLIDFLCSPLQELKQASPLDMTASFPIGSSGLIFGLWQAELVEGLSR